MRIGQVTQDNYMEYLKMFGGKDSKVLDKLWGKDEEAKGEKSIEEINAMLVKMGYVEEGMFLTGDESYKKIVPVSDEIKEKLIETVRRQFVTNGNGMGEARDGDEIGAIMKEYRANISPSERLSVTWTLSQIVQSENKRLVNYVKANVPGWQHGQSISPSILKEAVSGNSLDIKV